MLAFLQKKLKIDNMKPMISVIMSIYKEPIEWIKKSIDSILLQSFRDFEFIIVVDNPFYAELCVLLKEYEGKDHRITIIYNETNIGLTKSLNKAIGQAQGKYIARMDADDIALENRFDIQITFLENNPSYAVCTPMIDVIDEQDVVVMSSDKVYLNCDQSNLIWECNVVHPGVMMKRSLIELRTPLYNETYRTSQDYELWTFLTLNKIKIKYMAATLLKYRHSSQQVGHSRRQEQFKNFSVIRRNFITKYLDPTGQNLNEKSSANEVLDYIKHASLETYPKIYLNKIVYLLYYTLICDSKKYYILYLLNKKYSMLNMGLFYIFAITRLLWNKNTLPKFKY